MAKKRRATVTIKLNRDGSTTYKSTGGFDLRTLFPKEFGSVNTTSDRTDPADAAEQAGES